MQNIQKRFGSAGERPKPFSRLPRTCLPRIRLPRTCLPRIRLPRTLPSTYSPSAYLPSTYSPFAYPPSAYSPSAYSASAYPASAYSPSTYPSPAYSPPRRLRACFRVCTCYRTARVPASPATFIPSPATSAATQTDTPSPRRSLNTGDFWGPARSWSGCS